MEKVCLIKHHIKMQLYILVNQAPPPPPTTTTTKPPVWRGYVGIVGMWYQVTAAEEGSEKINSVLKPDWFKAGTLPLQGFCIDTHGFQDF